MTGEEIPLMQAAAQLRLSRLQAYDAVLTGKLEGRQNETRRWFVSVESVRRMASEREARRAASAVSGADWHIINNAP